MFEKIDIGKWEIVGLIGAGLLFIYRKTIGRLFSKTMDEDGDGKLQYKEWVRAPWLITALFVVGVEGILGEDRFTDTEFAIVILCSWGVEYLVVYLNKKGTNPSSSGEVPYDIPR